MKRNLILKLYILFFVLSFIAPTADAFESMGSENPNLIIGKDYRIPVLQAGTHVRIGIPLVNNGLGDATNIFVTPIIDDHQKYPFVIDRMTAKQRVPSIDRLSSEDVGLYFTVKHNADATTYPLRLTIEYSSRTGTTFSFSDTIFVKIENDSKLPKIQLNQVQVDGNRLVAGQSSQVTLELQNTGDLLAKDVQVRLAGMSASGLRLATPRDTVTISQFPSKHFKTAVFEVVAASDLASGTYALDLIIDYKDELGKAYTTEAKLYLEVDANGSGDTDFSFKNLIYPQGEMAPTQPFNISFELHNSGKNDAKGVRVTVDGGGDILPRTAAIRNVGDLKAGQSTALSFSMFARDGVETKNYPIKLTVEYEGRNKATQSISQYLGVFVRNSSADDNLIPKVIVDNYDYGQHFIKAGESFPLTISFFNTSRNTPVKNISINLSSEGDVFSPVNSSNSFYISDISANSKVVRTVQLQPKIDAAFKNHNLYVDIQYQDDKGKTHSTKEQVGIPVIQEIKLMVSNIETSPEAFVGNPIPISTEFYNVGRATIRNLVISVEGDKDKFSASESSLYIGNLEPGKSNYYDVTIYPSQVGPLAGRLVFSYNDEADNSFAVEKEFSLQVSEAMPAFHEMPFPGDMPMEQPQDNKRKYLIGGAVVAFLAGAGYMYRRRKKRLEEVDLDE